MFTDFIVKHDEETETVEALTEKILYSIVVNRLKAKKPLIWFIGGDSGEGKSFTILHLQQIILKLQGIDLKDVIDDVNVYTPIEYARKLDALLGMSNDKEKNKRLRKVNVLAIHEARELIKAKNWYSFLNQAVGDINAMSRSVKRLCIFVVSQFIRDIDTTIRYTLNFYSTVKRPRNRYARLYINVIWKDDRDLEKPKLKKRRLSGYVIDKHGRRRRYSPVYLELTMIDKELLKRFEENDAKAKRDILRKKLDKLIKNMELELSEYSTKVDSMVSYYADNPEMLKYIGRRGKRGFKIKDEVKEMHDLTPSEVRDFQAKLNATLKQKGIAGDDEADELEETKEDNKNDVS